MRWAGFALDQVTAAAAAWSGLACGIADAVPSVAELSAVTCPAQPSAQLPHVCN